MTIVILIVVISYVLLLSLCKAASKDSYKDFEEFKLDSNIKEDKNEEIA